MTAIRRRPRLEDFGQPYRLSQPLYVGPKPRRPIPLRETEWPNAIRIAIFTAASIGAAFVFFGGLRLL